MSAVNDLVTVPLDPFAGVGRSFEQHRRVRLGDITPSGRLRLDAVARYLQDVANDDAYDSGIANPGAWVVRRTVIEVRRWPSLREDVSLRTWCSGIGASWAERRTAIRGAGGGRVEAASLWVQLDPHRGRPTRLDEGFLAVYGPSTGGRRVRSKLVLGDDAPAADAPGPAAPGPDAPGPAAPTVPPGDGAHRQRFPVRRTDLDIIGHVNNAVAWAMVEHALPTRSDLGGRFELEHHDAIELDADPALVTIGDRLWVFDGPRLCVAVAVQGAAVAGGQPTSR